MSTQAVTVLTGVTGLNSMVEGEEKSASDVVNPERQQKLSATRTTRTKSHRMGVISETRSAH